MKLCHRVTFYIIWRQQPSASFLSLMNAQSPWQNDALSYYSNKLDTWNQNKKERLNYLRKQSLKHSPNELAFFFQALESLSNINFFSIQEFWQILLGGGLGGGGISSYSSFRFFICFILHVALDPLISVLTQIVTYRKLPNRHREEAESQRTFSCSKTCKH